MEMDRCFNQTNFPASKQYFDALRASNFLQRDTHDQQVENSDIQFFLEANDLLKEFYHSLSSVMHDQVQAHSLLLTVSKRHRLLISRWYNVLSNSEVAPEHLEVSQILLKIWHLCEAFLMDQGEQVGPRLIEWIQEHYSSWDTEKIEEQKQQLQKVYDPEKIMSGTGENVFWKTLCEFVAHGLTDEAECVLKMHSAFQKGRRGWMRGFDMHEAVHILLREMPRPEGLLNQDSFVGTSAEQFVENWKTWNVQVTQLMKHPLLTEASEKNFIIELLDIMRGEPSALEKYCKTWDQLMVAELLYKSPETKKYDLMKRLELLIDELPSDQVFEAIILRVLDVDKAGDALTICRELSAGNGLAHLCITAHLTDLLCITGSITPQIFLEDNLDLREILFLELADEIKVSGLSWELSAAYLGLCEQRGEKTLLSYIQREEPRTERDLRQLVSFCWRKGQEQRNHKDKDRADLWEGLAQVKASTFAVERMNAGFWGPAAYWFCQAKDNERLVSMCHRLFDKAARLLNPDTLKSRRVSDAVETVLQQLEGVQEAVADYGTNKIKEIVFLVEYNRFAKALCDISRSSDAMEEDEQKYKACLRQAFESLSRMSGKKLAPNRLWPQLLQLGAYLFETAQKENDVLIGSEQLHVLMLWLHELQTTPLPWLTDDAESYKAELNKIPFKQLHFLIMEAMTKALYAEHARKKPEEQSYSVPITKQQINVHFQPAASFFPCNNADDLLAPLLFI